jgi:hypothetical protein
MTKEIKTLSFSTKTKKSTSYLWFNEIPAGQNPANFVLINGRYFFNDYDTNGNYLRSIFLK